MRMFGSRTDEGIVSWYEVWKREKRLRFTHLEGEMSTPNAEYIPCRRRSTSNSTNKYELQIWAMPKLID
jgi:hypothetical protein